MGDVEPPLGQELLDVAIAQREAEVEPNCMLDDHRRKAVTAVGDFSHRASLPSASLPSYPVTLTKPPIILSPLDAQPLFSFRASLFSFADRVSLSRTSRQCDSPPHHRTSTPS